MSGREWVCRGCICFNKCLWYPAKAGQSVARSWPSLSACALGEGNAGAGSAGGGAGAAAGFRCRRVRRFAPREESWGLPALQSSPGKELFLGRADPNLQNGPPLGWLRYYLSSQVRGEAGPGRGWQRGLYLAETLEVTGQRRLSLQEARVAARLGTRWSPWKVGLLLFTVCSKH